VFHVPFARIFRDNADVIELAAIPVKCSTYIAQRDANYSARARACTPSTR
jgi:hypothetical protein